ncbi:MAG: aldehyde dehydrogenase family protein [Bilifractor sp.]|jgi:aldehyde dehydrogenase (NAD+)
MKKYDLFIGGKYVSGHSGKYISVENPATRRTIAAVPAGDKEDVNRAVQSASEGFPVWSSMSGRERAAYLRKMAEFFDKNGEEIAQTVTDELGAPVSMSLDWHVSAAGSEIRYYADIAEYFPYEEKRKGYIRRREPFGIVAALTPWNYPLEQITLKMIPALAAGNCVILKPSQMTPLTSYYFAEAARYASLPYGVLNIVTGRGSEVGNLLARHPDIRMISFTGSTTAGREVGENALSNIKKFTLELGGKSAALVLPGADLRAACVSVAEDCFMNTGQTCNAMTRMLVPRDKLSRAEEFLKEAAEKYVTGDPMDPDTDIGPLINEKAFYKVCDYIRLGIKEGAKLVTGSVPDSSGNGYYVKPVVFSEVSNNMRIAREEIFGPVLCVIPYDTPEEALDIINDSPYGLCGGVYGEEEEAVEAARHIESGSVRINGAPVITGAPFGGYKQSGIGREASEDTFEEYLEIKAILI